jgi:hypothetical protein
MDVTVQVTMIQLRRPLIRLGETVGLPPSSQAGSAAGSAQRLHIEDCLRGLSDLEG